MIDIKRDIYGMGKQASIVPSIGNGIAAIGDAVAGMGAYVIAASLATGVTTGWTLAQLTAKRDTDMETAKKSYENERLSADIGYLKSQIEQERETKANKPKSVMLFR